MSLHLLCKLPWTHYFDQCRAGSDFQSCHKMLSVHIPYAFWILIIPHNFTWSCRDLMIPVFTKNCITAELNLQKVNCGCCLHGWLLGLSFRSTGFWVGGFCTLYSWKTEQCYCFFALLSLSGSEICLWWFTPLSSAPTTNFTRTWEWIRFDISGSSRFRAVKEICHAEFDNSLHMPWSPKTSISIEQSDTLSVIFPDLFQQSQLPFCQVISSIIYRLLNRLPWRYLTNTQQSGPSPTIPQSNHHPPLQPHFLDLGW